MRPSTGVLMGLFLLGCAGSGDPVSPPAPGPVPPPPPPPSTPPAPTWDVDALGIPRIATSDYIALASVAAVSKFRSGVGHDYSDAFERCRSMKHYFMPIGTIDWSSIPVTSPVTGTVESVLAEWAGSQIRIRAAAQPAFRFILFHVTLAIPLSAGTPVTAGQPLGHHVGSQTMSDIAVGVDTPAGYKLVSWFDTMTDEVWAGYAARGVASRAAAIVSRSARDADPLGCTGETFTSPGTLENWVTLAENP